MSSKIFETKKKQYIQTRPPQGFADRFSKDHSIADLINAPIGPQKMKTAGRITSLRVMGKALFANLYDASGTIQLYLHKSSDHGTPFDAFADKVSIGDFVGVEGEVFCTRTGQKTLNVQSFALLNKCLRTLPEKFHGIGNIETRYRHRYLDVIMNPGVRDLFEKRIRIVKTLRQYLEQNGFLEVETPILQTTVSGAMAKPFYTHHNALDLPCTLRIAPETWLKRLIGAGFDRVYEFARCFRNEGLSPAHLQEFTMLEFYAAYWNWEDQMTFCTDLTRHIIRVIFGNSAIIVRDQEIKFDGEWPVWTLSELIKRDTGLDILANRERTSLIQEMKCLGLWVEDMSSMSWANIVDAVYKSHSRPKLIQPCYVTQYPAEMAPLARRNSVEPGFVDLFQLVVCGIELIKAYSELVDPLEQRERLLEQAEAREGGDLEAMPMDEDFLVAMEHGLPPIAGVGIGIDRMVALLCGKDHIKEAVFFPLLRPD